MKLFLTWPVGSSVTRVTLTSMTLTRISDSTKRYQTSASTDAQLHKGTRYGFGLVDGRPLASLHSGTHYPNHLTNYTSTSPLGTRRQELIAFAARYQTMRLVYPRASFKHAPMYYSIIICQPNSSLRRDLKLRPWNQLGVSFGYVSQAWVWRYSQRIWSFHHLRPEVLRGVPENTILCWPKQTRTPDQSKVVDLPQQNFDRACYFILT